MRRYLNYIIFGLIVLLVVGLAVNHSRHMRSLVDALSHGSPEERKAAATELIQAEQFGDTITGESIETRKQAAIALSDLGNTDAIKQAVALLKDPDKPVRDQAIVTLKQIGAANPDNLKELMNGLKDGDLNIRKGTILALTDPDGGIGPRTNPDVVLAVVDIMKREDGARGPGGNVLSSSTFIKGGANDRSVPALLALLDDKDNGVKRGAADALGKIGDARADQKLITLMHTPGVDPSVRRVVIGAIALIASPESEQALTEAITNVNDDPEARDQAAAGLGKIATPTAVATLIKTFTDYDLDLRAAAVSALSRAASPDETEAGAQPAAAQQSDSRQSEVVAQLTQALQNPNQDVRLRAAQALQKAHSPASVGALVKVLSGDTREADVRAAAATALGFNGDSAAVQPLIRALSDPAGEVQTSAGEALTNIGPAATQALIAVTREGGANAYYAAKALGMQGAQNSQTLTALEQAAQAVTAPVAQRWAAVALGETRRPEARTVLQQLAQSSDPDVAYVAQSQLNRIQ